MVYLRSTWIVLCPDPDVLLEVVGAQDAGVPGQVVEIIHYHSNKQVQHQEAKSSYLNPCVLCIELNNFFLNGDMHLKHVF